MWQNLFHLYAFYILDPNPICKFTSANFVNHQCAGIFASILIKILYPFCGCQRSKFIIHQFKCIALVSQSILISSALFNSNVWLTLKGMQVLILYNQRQSEPDFFFSNLQTSSTTLVFHFNINKFQTGNLMQNWQNTNFNCQFLLW